MGILWNIFNNAGYGIIIFIFYLKYFSNRIFIAKVFVGSFFIDYSCSGLL